MNQKPRDSGGVAVHPKNETQSGQSSDPLDPRNFDPDWVRNQPAVAPAEPERMEMPHLEATPQAVDKDNKPRDKVDFENLPEFVAQRKMLRNAKIGALLGSVVVLAVVVYIAFFAGKKTVKPIIDDLK